MDDIEQLKTIRSLALTQLVELHNDPQPSYTVDGQTTAWRDYVAQLGRTIEWCDAKLAALQPFEFRSQGAT